MQLVQKMVVEVVEFIADELARAALGKPQLPAVAATTTATSPATIAATGMEAEDASETVAAAAATAAAAAASRARSAAHTKARARMVRVQPPRLFPPPKSQADGKVSVQVLTTAGAAAFRLRAHPDADVSSLLREASQRMKVSRGSLSFTHGGKILKEDRKLRSEVPGISGDERPLPPSLVIHVRAEAGVSRHGVSRPTAYTFGTAGLTGKKPARSHGKQHAQHDAEEDEDEDEDGDDYDDATPRGHRSPRPERYATADAFEEKARQRRVAFESMSSRASSAARVAFSPPSSESSHGGMERAARRRPESAPAHSHGGSHGGKASGPPAQLRTSRTQLRGRASEAEEDWTEASDGADGGVDWAEAAEMAAELAAELAAKAAGAAGAAEAAEAAEAAAEAAEVAASPPRGRRPRSFVGVVVDSAP